jgi:hypothetical protein
MSAQKFQWKIYFSRWFSTTKIEKMFRHSSSRRHCYRERGCRIKRRSMERSVQERPPWRPQTDTEKQDLSDNLPPMFRPAFIQMLIEMISHASNFQSIHRTFQWVNNRWQYPNFNKSANRTHDAYLIDQYTVLWYHPSCKQYSSMVLHADLVSKSENENSN